MAKKYSKCVVKSPVSATALFVLVGAAAGTMLIPQSAPIGAVVGGFVVIAILKAM